MVREISSAKSRFLSDLASINDRMNRAQRDVASGKRVHAASDSPDQVSALLTVRSELSSLQQTQANLNRTGTELSAAEQALQSAVKLFDRVRTLGMTGASGVHTAATRKSIADELGAILERFVGLANTDVDGRNLFSGDADRQFAYSIDLSNSPPWSAYQGTTSSRRAIHPTGVPFAVAKTAQEIFDNSDPSKNVFVAIETLRQALLANDESAIQTAMAPLAGVSEHLNSMLSFYGFAQAQVTEAKDTAAQMVLLRKTQISALEDADITEAIMELQQARFQQEAAYKVQASLPQGSLFDYLG